MIYKTEPFTEQEAELVYYTVLKLAKDFEIEAIKVEIEYSEEKSFNRELDDKLHHYEDLEKYYSQLAEKVKYHLLPKKKFLKNAKKDLTNGE